MKKYAFVIVSVVLILSLCAVAYADTFYLRYVSNTSWQRTDSTSTRGSGNALVDQTGNVNTGTGVSGGRVRYGANITNSTSTNYFTANNTTSAGNTASINPTVSSSISRGATMYLNLAALTAPSTDQWEISGYWHG